MKWIKIIDELPIAQEKILIYSENGIETGYYNPNNKYEDLWISYECYDDYHTNNEGDEYEALSRETIYNPTYWMKLPEDP